MGKNFTFKKKKSHKLFFGITATLFILSISIISYAEIGLGYQAKGKTDKTMNCDIVYSIPDEELVIEFGETENAPREYGVIRRCENPEIVCYYIGGTRNIFCQFKRFDNVRSKGNLRPE